MTEFLRLRVPSPSTPELLGNWGDSVELVARPHCEHRVIKRMSELTLEVKHNRREEMMIGTLMSDIVIHADLAGELANRGYTGYRLKPASVRFRDGRISNDYRELVVVGWAGLARPESGVHVVKECPYCPSKRFSCLRDAGQLVNWSQWTGDDFVVLWPLGRLITKRVAETLEILNVSSHLSQNLLELEGQEFGLPPEEWGFSTGSLSGVLPEDLAIKYGQTLGIV